MADNLTVKERSDQMRRVRSTDTKPEMSVRRLIFSMGYRYRLHRSDLPGSPDLTFAGRKRVIFVHGCFWHRHPGCALARMPKSNLEYWKPKLEANRSRDLRNIRELRRLGWKVLVIWECEITEDSEDIARHIRDFLED